MDLIDVGIKVAGAIGLCIVIWVIYEVVTSEPRWSFKR